MTSSELQSDGSTQLSRGNQESTTEESGDEYSIRWFRDADRDAFVELYNDTFGGGSDDWFEWKYVDNPRVSHVPILVADADGELAGARPQVPFLMNVGDETVLACRFGDTMVHPDHRRKGVFTRLTEHALDHYSQVETRFCFNCPNDLSRPGFLKAGGEIVANLPSFYRVQNPAALTPTKTDSALPRLAGQLATPAVGAYLEVVDRLFETPQDVTVTSHDDIPVDILTELADRGRPVGVHAVRDSAFLEWRYQNPRWDYRAYTASLDSLAVAAIVVGTQTDADGVTTTNVVDVLPGVGDATRDDALRALLDVVVTDYAGSDLLAYNGHAIPRRVLREAGFYFDGATPLAQVTSPTPLVAYDLSTGTDTPWQVGRRNLRNEDSWRLQYAELDAR